MTAALSINQLRIDAHLVLVALHRAFQNIANAELLADFPGVGVLALESEGGVARDDEGAAEAREVGSEIFGYAISEIVLARIAREVGERKYDHRRTRGCRRVYAALGQKEPTTDRR